MLVLSRKIGEKIHVGNDITIEVRRVAGNRVTLAVDAPRNVRILRGELREAATEFEIIDDQAAKSDAYVIPQPRLATIPSMPHVVS